MRQHLFQLFMFTLLVGITGCDAPYRNSLSESWDFSIDGTKWILVLTADVDEQGNRVASSLLIHPVIHFTDGNTITISDANHRHFRDNITTEVNSLYFIREGETIEKKYHELGIDASRLTADQAMLDYLRPIFETLIRENVKPPERETEK